MFETSPPAGPMAVAVGLTAAVAICLSAAVGIGPSAMAVALGLRAEAPVNPEVGAVGHMTGFAKGVGEGVWSGAKGTVASCETVGKDSVRFATDAGYRDEVADSAVDMAKAVGGLALAAATNPRKAAGKVGDAASDAWNSLDTAYERAAAEGHASEFTGRMVGHAAYAVGVAYATGRAYSLIFSDIETGGIITSIPKWQAPDNPRWWQRLFLRARLGVATTGSYADTFYKAYPESKATVTEIHHAIPQYVLNKYPGLVSVKEMHSLENLRGIPNKLDHDEIHREWDKFYEENPTTTRKALLKKAAEIDAKWGSRFDPPVLSPVAMAVEKTKNLVEETRTLVEVMRNSVPIWGIPNWALAK